MKSLGIEEGYAGIGHCVLDYAVSDEPKTAKQKEKGYYLKKYF